MGIEEEYFLVDPRTRTVAVGASRVLPTARRALGEQVSGEFTEYQVEAKTPPCTGIAEVRDQVSGMRAAVREAAAREGLAVYASGTPVLGADRPPPVREDARYREGQRRYGATTDAAAVCATHVHVAMPDREHAVLVGNHLRPWLPVLIALAANSPFHDHRDTGYACWRTMATHLLPVSGPPPRFADVDEYDRAVAGLLEMGALVDEATLFWDVRASAHLPTVEVRPMDAIADVEQVIALAALVRAMAVTALDRVRRGDTGPAVADHVLRAACWRAARDGCTGQGYDPRDDRLRPVAQLVRRLLHDVGPVLDGFGELDVVRPVLHRLCRDGGGARRQRRAHAHRNDLRDVVDHLITRTAAAGHGVPASPQPAARG
ncbi:glutamate--cysteine ligase [Saccharothrix stipae]